MGRMTPAQGTRAQVLTVRFRTVESHKRTQSCRDCRNHSIQSTCFQRVRSIPEWQVKCQDQCRMDVPRTDFARLRRRRRILIAVAGVVLVAIVTLGLSRLKPAAPSVERATVWVDTVKRGPVIRQVRGLGTLVPTDIRWIPAANEGRVERLLIQPGTKVRTDYIILELRNPQLQQAALDAEWQLKAAEADYHNVAMQLQNQLLGQKAESAKVQSEFHEAKLKADTDQELARLGVISQLALKVSVGKAQELASRSDIEQERLAKGTDSLQSQLAAQNAKVEQVRALYQLKRQQLDSLRVRAGADGVLQELPLKLGQWVTPGTTLAKVVQPQRLKAELKVPETQAKDVQLGLPATVDTHNGVIEGHVIRIDPAVQAGTVTVDVALDGVLPQGARPDLSVDGTIDLERLANVLYVGRPAFGRENSTVGMFRLEADGSTGARTQVKLGRSSVNSVEILQGLKEGDQVILSDMSRWDTFDRIRLE
jgi:HlyD family secretion protein